MTRIVPLALVLASAAASADEPKTAADQLARFALDGCDYLHANGWDAKARRRTADSKLAAHFGRVIRTEPSGIAREYHLSAPGFPGWDVLFSSSLVELKPPASMTLTLHELEAVLGPAQEPDWDNAKPGGVRGDDKPRSEEREFARPAGRRLCIIGVSVERNSSNAGAGRVLAFRFSD